MGQTYMFYYHVFIINYGNVTFDIESFIIYLVKTWEHDTNKDLSIQDSLLSTLHR